MATGADGRAHRIVVGVDGSPGSLAALDWAAGLAEATSAGVEAITAWAWPTGYGAAVFFPSDYDPAADAEDVAVRAVDAVAAAHPGAMIVPLVVEGHPAPVLIEASHGADLLAVGSRGHGEFAALVLGSVSEHCAAHAHSPVLVVRDA